MAPHQRNCTGRSIDNGGYNNHVNFEQLSNSPSIHPRRSSRTQTDDLVKEVNQTNHLVKSGSPETQFNYLRFLKSYKKYDIMYAFKRLKLEHLTLFNP
ncbi:hypothetical protein [Parasitella parasitica]|uniref:Uncharacterized protein n=1 Tax=Parasitella parasitica TaxID=35722 RepID=A0A0B7NWU0_9FUNG|nr:hypothetical protein [Parasitella parasitica]